MSMKIRKGDKVIILCGEDKGTQGPVLGTVPAKGRVVVQGVSMAKCHMKPRQQNTEGSIVEREQAIDVSDVQLICSKCGKPTRVGIKRVPKTVSGKEKMMAVRVCKKCGAEDI